MTVFKALAHPLCHLTFMTYNSHNTFEENSGPEAPRSLFESRLELKPIFSFEALYPSQIGYLSKIRFNIYGCG